MNVVDRGTGPENVQTSEEDLEVQMYASAVETVVIMPEIALFLRENMVQSPRLIGSKAKFLLLVDMEHLTKE